MLKWFVSLCCCLLSLGCATIRPEPAAPAAAALMPALFLPEVVYAVPGVEMNIYFDNILLDVAPGRYVYDVDCSKGRHDAKRWRFTPAPEDVGTHAWKVRVIDNSGVICEGSTRIEVVAPPAEAGRPLSILVIGDSLTAASVYPARLLSQARAVGRLELTMIGSNGPGRKPQPGGVAHEGFGGWTWKSFVTGGTSQFLRFAETDLKKEHGELDIPGYLQRYHGGQAPDVITVMLGINDIFNAQDETIEASMTEIFGWMDRLLAALRAAAPAARMGVALITPGAGSQDAFGKNYGCRQTGWQYRKNQHRLNQAMAARFAQANPHGVSLIPACVNLDRDNNFPQVTEAVNQDNPAQITRLNNGVHPGAAGYNQIGDTFFCWLLAQLAR